MIDTETIQQLIKEGYDASAQCKIDAIIRCPNSSNINSSNIESEAYESWILRCRRYLEQYHSKNELTLQFVEVSKDLSISGTSLQFDKLISILKAIMEMPPIDKSDDIDMVLGKICANFHKCAKSIQDRHNNRETLVINDEYDMQDLLRGILRLFFDDVRPEEYTPSYAGSNSRVDFYLPQYQTYIETKMTRNGLADKEVGEQLIIDIARYKEKGRKLICLVYDKEGKLKNPYGLAHDLEKNGSDAFNVKVYITP